MASLASALSELLAAGAGLCYGLGFLILALGWSIRQEEYWSAPSEDQQARLRLASQHLWSLRKDIVALAKHNFLQLPDGPQLHYLTPSRGISSGNKLVIFLHGFPDSAYLYRRQLASSLADEAQLVALDLPGCGGSDSLASYGPDQMLNTIAGAIVLLKQRYLEYTPSSRCILVGHDWGGVIAYRIAAETKQLVDRVITINAPYMAYTANVLRSRVSRGKTLLSECRLSEAASELGPVLSQIRKSGYTYMLTLPFPLATRMPRLAACLIKFVQRMEHGHHREPTPDEVAVRLAMACGPGPSEQHTIGQDGSIYGSSVFARSQTLPPGDWDQKVLLYSAGLLLGNWVKTYPGRRETSVSVERPAQFKCPVDVIFGLQDVALDPRVVLDGIETCFTTVSDEVLERVMRVPECGHWSILQEKGAAALESKLHQILQRSQ
ncbi:hypothetical protein DOTSEDRAFT_72764 [Dothistroma septosporum NZE10]|uniref:AB hydrolase-1 domain-containing protein n=1 Tax=Dothistroma septosporum (strain NZE10 / CBS 128990) TaxID=675120 RepID=M2YND6_DOTSN|nr:hypothetical protein DOTSEDRAFT_72764 [Dothistroma septosporum NZE10]